MELYHRICCGIDVHQKLVVACLRQVDASGAVRKEVRHFSTTFHDLLRLSDWLTDHQCTIAAMESTGVYWKPVWHVLGEHVEVIVGNARAIARTPGRKTDKTDAEWLAELLAHGLIKPSFIPPAPVRDLRDFLRTRTGLVESRTQAKNRVHRLLEDTNLKLGTVASDVFGKSGRMMLAALIAGERDAQVLANLACGLLRKKLSELELALTGRFNTHHAVLLQVGLDLVDQLSAHIQGLDAHIEAAVQAYFQNASEQLQSIPGVHKTTARIIISEIGTDMARFGSASRLASWAGLCPGNNESAGKRSRRTRRKGNRALQRVLVQSAWAARKTDSFIGRRFRNWEARMGGKKAAVAIAHKLIILIYSLLNEGTFYDEKQYEGVETKQRERRQRQAVRTLRDLGFAVKLDVAAA